ncbi:homeobox-leucine zipper protein ROC6-like [Brachypodium distachyon]|uniref:homeobox-leucine zipper protein ROC6-like n=1 Tax=Brachypodium distachyon TaxID=15368 RepID=UPI000D0DC13F|nr:homeobox-leucine zipper protein ROC6-like [Brachypodium distachyon]|eukprot:XP_024314576.1 homeobox-leucine zipper protein ROC6-like [Brachypodium distachyon]
MDGEGQQGSSDHNIELDFSDDNNLGDETDGVSYEPNTDDDANAAAANEDSNAGGGGAAAAGRTAPRSSKRHRREQIQQLEAVFQQCPHPDEQLRLDLSKRLGMGLLQVKFWFQNRRSAKKVRINKMEQQEGKKLREENEMLLAENKAMKAEIQSRTCIGCGGPRMHIHDCRDTPEKQRLRMENAMLKDQLMRTKVFVSVLTGKDVDDAAAAAEEGALPAAYSPYGLNNGGRPLVINPAAAVPAPSMSSAARSIAASQITLLDHLIGACEEFKMIASMNEPMWLRTSDGDVLNNQAYKNATYPGILGICPKGFAVDGTRTTGIVLGNAADLTSIFMDPVRTH